MGMPACMCLSRCSAMDCPPTCSTGSRVGCAAYGNNIRCEQFTSSVTFCHLLVGCRKKTEFMYTADYNIPVSVITRWSWSLTTLTAICWSQHTCTRHIQLRISLKMPAVKKNSHVNDIFLPNLSSIKPQWGNQIRLHLSYWLLTVHWWIQKLDNESTGR